MYIQQLENNFIKYIFYLFPILLVTGPLLPDLFLSIMSMIFVGVLIKQKNFTCFKNFFFLFYFILCMIIIFSVFISPAPFEKQGTSIFYLRFGIFVIFLNYFFSQEKNLYNFSKIFFYIFIFILLDSFIQLFYGYNIFGFERINIYRISSVFGDELIMGSFISKIFAINIIYLFMLKLHENKKIYLFVFLIVSSLILILLSGERTALGIFSFQIIFGLIFLKNRIFKKGVFYSFLSVLIIFGSIKYFSQIQEYRNTTLYDSINNISQRFGHGIKNYLSFEKNKIKIIESHQGHYETAFNIFKHNKLFGTGIKSFRYVCSDKKYKSDAQSCSTHPHNTLLLFASELGIIGLFIYTFFILYILKVTFTKFFNRKNKNNLNYDKIIIINGGILSSILPILPNGNFFNNFMSIMFFILMSYFFHFNYKKMLISNI